jgi:hypothetical protein
MVSIDNIKKEHDERLAYIAERAIKLTDELGYSLNKIIRVSGDKDIGSSSRRVLNIVEDIIEATGNF